jgi:high-affinity iron transporter
MLELIDYGTHRLAALMAAVALLLGCATTGARAALASSDEVRRVLTLLTAVREEYRESFDDAGTLARPLEYEEARGFLAEARLRWRNLGVVQGTDAARQQFDDIGAAIDQRAAVASVLEQIGAVRAQISLATGVAEEVYLAARPSPARGARTFIEHCASCHGARGDGQGPEAARLERKPTNFTDPVFMRGETPYDFFSVITVGKRGAAMPAWEDVLTPQERWDLVSYVWALTRSDAQKAEGQGIYLSQCASCHGAGGDGVGPYAATLITAVPDLTQTRRLAQRSDAELFATVRAGVAGTAMPAFRTLSDTETWKVIAFLRGLSLGDGRGGADEPDSAGEGKERPAVAEGEGPHAEGTTANRNALQETRRLLAAALRAYQAQDPQALYVVSEAYFQFEPLEKKLAVSAPHLTRSVETRFLELRGVLAKPGAQQEAAALVAAIDADLAAAAAALQSHAGGYPLLVQSATIILREGFEVVLIIGALLAYVAKSGNSQMRRPILAGTVAGVGVSLATGYAFLRVFHGASAGAIEALEGATMLLAAVVLFWVSYWLVSKAEADKWQRYIQGKVKVALSRGSGLALAGAAFLAVYREGVETVLFYQALVGSAPGAASAVVGGLFVGGAALAVVYGLFRRFGMRVPIRQFFLGTSVLLYYMAIVFTGKGVAELQEAGWIAVTPVSGAPRVDFLGVYPTVETLLAQGVLVVLLVYAIVVTVRQRERSRQKRHGDGSAAACPLDAEMVGSEAP